MAADAALARESLAQRGIARRKQMASKNDRENVADDDFLEMNSHVTVEACRAPEKFTPVSKSLSA